MFKIKHIRTCSERSLYSNVCVLDGIKYI